MKILVFAHRLEVGGTQVNAIELTAALRDRHDHEVVVFATPGPMLDLVRRNGIRFLPAPDAYHHPSFSRMRALRDAVRAERPDVVHVWDWWQCLDAYWSVYLAMGVPMVVTDMSMSVGRVLPMNVPMTFGTPELVDRARAAGRRRVELLLPPVDVQFNAPGVVSSEPLRAANGITGNDILLVTVSRFSEWLKAESLRRTIAAVRVVGRELPVKFLLVGDGTLRPELQRMADDVNAQIGREAVVLTGALLDPRPAYAAADIVIGMGGSALRAMAFGKPVIVVGERGFSAPFTPDSAQTFYHQGIYGLGDGLPDNSRLVADIQSLAEHPDRLPALGEFARQFVLKYFTLEAAAAKLSELCGLAVAQKREFRVNAADGVRTAAVFLAGALRRSLSASGTAPVRR
jgi:glycosyltransferase involved in cell wall biosynthesis